MLDGINGQDAESDRNAELHGHLGQALGALASHVFEVRSAATNDRAQGDDCRELAFLGDFLRNQRNFEGARCADDGDVAFAHAVANQGINCTADQAFNDEAVETAHYQSVAAFRGDEGTFDGLQGHSIDLLKSRDASRTHPSVIFEPRIQGRKQPVIIRRARILQLPDRNRISH
ncbi:hypothetical protein D3C78_1349680 [compost metagenome]